MTGYWEHETMLLGKDAQTKLMQGVEKVATAVRGTLGPAARTVVVEGKEGYPRIYNDGFSIANAVHDRDPFIQMGIELTQHVAAQAQQKSGDGTTTATILAHALCEEGFKLIEDGMEPSQLKIELEDCAEQIISRITEEKMVNLDMDDIRRVATIAANNDEVLGDLITNVLWEVGESCAISIENGTGHETTYELEGGLEVHSGSISPHFPAEIHDAHTLLIADKVQNFDSLLPTLEQCVKEGRALVIIADDYHPQVLSNLLINVMQGKISATVLKTPGMGEARDNWMLDIHAIVGGKILSPITNNTLDNIQPDSLGSLNFITIKKDASVIVVDNEPNQAHLDTLYQKLEKADHEWDKQTLERRLARLNSGVGTIKVGGYTEVEMKERKERIDDAVNAVKAAMKNGVVRGGGVAMSSAAVNIKSDAIWRCFKEPMQLISDNCGISYDEHIKLVVKNNVYDPLDVVINSIRSAVSVASLVLLSDALLTLPR